MNCTVLAGPQTCTRRSAAPPAGAQHPARRGLQLLANRELVAGLRRGAARHLPLSRISATRRTDACCQRIVVNAASTCDCTSPQPLRGSRGIHLLSVAADQHELRRDHGEGGTDVPGPVGPDGWRKAVCGARLVADRSSVAVVHWPLPGIAWTRSTHRLTLTGTKEAGSQPLVAPPASLRRLAGRRRLARRWWWARRCRPPAAGEAAGASRSAMPGRAARPRLCAPSRTRRRARPGRPAEPARATRPSGTPGEQPELCERWRGISALMWVPRFSGHPLDGARAARGFTRPPFRRHSLFAALTGTNGTLRPFSSSGRHCHTERCMTTPAGNRLRTGRTEAAIAAASSTAGSP